MIYNNENISFSQKLKTELTSNKYSKIEHKEIILIGLKVNASININNHQINLFITSFYSSVIKFFYLGIKTFYPNKKISIKAANRSLFGKEKKEFKLEILDCEDLYHELNEQNFKSFFCASIAIFLLSGNVSSPSSTNYNLYISLTSENLAKQFLKLSKKHKQMEFHLLEYKNKYLLKINKADNIANFFKYICCYKAFFEYEDVRITRDHFNNLNRLSNLDICNQTKAIVANQKHIKLIAQIYNAPNLLHHFSFEQKQIMQIKLNNEDLTAQEITLAYFEKYKTEINKSKINNLMEKIKKLLV